MSTAAVGGVTGEDRQDTARSFGTANDKSSPAMIVRSFRIDPGTDESRTLSTVGDTARRSGWTVIAAPYAVSGTRPMPGSDGNQTASLSVYISPIGDPPVRHLLIVLRNPS